MKKIGLAIIALLFTLACTDDYSPIIGVEDEYIELPFACSIASIEMDEEKLTRSNPEDAIYTVQVYEKSPNTNTYIPYAYGIFDDVSKMVIKMKKTDTYKINVGLLYNFFDKYQFGASNQTTYHTSANNAFVYSSDWQFRHLNSSISTGYDTFFELNHKDANRSMIECDSYTGIIYDFSPSTGVIDITLIRSAFGIQINVDGMTEGRIEWTGRPITPGLGANTSWEICSIEYSNPSYEQIFSVAQFMRSLETNNCNIVFDLSYYDAQGTKTILNNSKSITIYRNIKTIINITLKSDTNTEYDQSFNIDIDDNPETEETIEYSFEI